MSLPTPQKWLLLSINYGTRRKICRDVIAIVKPNRQHFWQWAINLIHDALSSINCATHTAALQH